MTPSSVIVTRSGAKARFSAYQGDLGSACGIDDAPAGAGPEILQHQHEAAARRRPGALPFGERRRHDFGGDGLRKSQIAIGILVAQAGRADAEQKLDVVIAHVLEIPARAGVAGNTGLPARIVDGRNGGHRFGTRDVGGHVGERQTLGSKTHIGAAGILERAQISADAVVMADACIDGERQAATGRRAHDIGHIGAQRLNLTRQHVLEQRVHVFARRQAEHGALLIDLAAAAQNRDRRAGLRAGEKLSGFAADGGRELGIVGGIVEVGEHEVLPHEDAELVAQLVEALILVDRRSRHAQHVHAGVAGELQPGPEGCGASGKRRDVCRRPHGAAAENRFAIEREAETASVGAAIDLDAAEARSAEIDRRGADADADFVQCRRAVRVRPPGGDIRQRQCCGEGLAVDRHHRCVLAAAGQRGLVL